MHAPFTPTAAAENIPHMGGPGSCTWKVPLSDPNETLSKFPSIRGKMLEESVFKPPVAEMAEYGDEAR